MKKQSKIQSAQNSFLLQAVYILSLVFLVLLFSSCEQEMTSENPVSEEFIPEGQLDSRILFIKTMGIITLRSIKI